MSHIMHVSSFRTNVETTETEIHSDASKEKVIEQKYQDTGIQTEKCPMQKEEDTHRLSRDTQTSLSILSGSEPYQECATQTKRVESQQIGVTVEEDKAPTTFEQSNEIEFLCTRVIQSHWRGHIARKRLKNEESIDILGTKYETKEWEKELERRLRPKTASDCKTLYSELEVWRKLEIEKMKNDNCINTLSLIERKQMEMDLLSKETKLLRQIDQMKANVIRSGRLKNIERKLDLMSQPKIWGMSSGEIVNVHTPFTIWAKELREMYQKSNDNDMSVDERLDVLLKIKRTVIEFDCILSRDISDLIDREADMLNRGREKETLSGLRTRLSNLFRQFIEALEFDPGSNN